MTAITIEADARHRVRHSHGAGMSGSGPVLPGGAGVRLRPGTVCRSSLVERLAAGRCPVVSVVAPAGYGKTTVLAQWAERSSQSFAWVPVDEQDNDPKVLLARITVALDAAEPIGGRVFGALASPGSSVPGSVVPRLGSALASMTAPVVLVLDDVHVLHNRECRAAVSVLADHVPTGSRLVLAGQSPPPLRIARLRAEGRITEVSPADLSMTRDEAVSLLRNAGVALGEDDAAELHRRTEGWPAGLYLAALYLREGGALPHAAASFDGGDQFVSDYLESELLSRISRDQRAFLTRTAVLERMSGALCDAALEQNGSVTVLAELARSNLLLVPLDRRGEWYRYHHLFRDMLLGELHRQEPGLLPDLRRRAASWYLRNDRPEEALEYFMAAGDVDSVACLAAQLGMRAYRRGRVTTVKRWFGWLEERRAIEGHPMTAVVASLLAALTGRPADAARWADVVDRWQRGDAARSGDPAVQGLAALLRALLCRRGARQMRADADEAARTLAAERFAQPAPALLQGVARVLSGELDDADALLEDAASIAGEAGAPEDLALALCERSLLAITRGEWSHAEAIAGQARTALRRAKMEDSVATPLVCAVHARTALHRADPAAARQELITAQPLRPLLTYALPHFAVQARIELARVHFTLADLAGARTLVREIDELLRRRPGMGTLGGQAQALRAQLSKQRGPSLLGESALTAAELRLLPLLSTHLSFPEIAAELVLSRNTIKSEANSIYRKLGASTRSQAVAQARELGLLAA